MSECRERQVAQVGAVNKGESATSLGQVGCREALKRVGVESNRSSAGRERWHVDLADISESQVGSALQVGEADLKILVVGGEGQSVGDVLHVVDVDGGQETVVVDVHASNSSQLDTGKRGQLSIGNVDGVGAGDALSKVQTLKSGQADPVDSVDGAQRAHRQGRQNGQAIQLKGSCNGVELVGRNGSELCCVSADKVSSNLLDTVDLDGARGLVRDCNVAIKASARCNRLGVCGAGDGERATAAVALCFFMLVILFPEESISLYVPRAEPARARAGRMNFEKAIANV